VVAQLVNSRHGKACLTGFMVSIAEVRGQVPAHCCWRRRFAPPWQYRSHFIWGLYNNQPGKYNGTFVGLEL